MRGPFPGIDPYLEDQGYWPDFYSTFLNCCRDALFDRIPENYEARIDERFRLFELDEERPRLIEPDATVVRRRGQPSPSVGLGGGRPLLLEPIMVPSTPANLAEERLAWIEIRRLPDRELVTVIELLSPSNKTGLGREDYLEKRRATLRQSVHLVELDFLLAGHRLPMGGPLPPGDFYAIVSRADRRTDCEVYAWSIRQPLPLIPIPLKAPDPDVRLDLLAVFTESYERGRYPRSVDYRAPLKLPLADDDHAWAEALPRPATPS